MQKYEEPIVEIITLEATDVITGSPDSDVDTEYLG